MQQGENRPKREHKPGRLIGNSYEQKAAEYLQERGYVILKRNFYTQFGEIDIIAKEGSYLVFIEVKYRSGIRGGHPMEAVDYKKQKRIQKSAQFFLLRYGYPPNTPCRFDVIGILGEEMIHIKDAFFGK